ncbi:hypothetical protein OROGR_009744 [Orobanche gracilis]
MYRQSPSRNQRSKGIKVKYVLQICLLLAVCFWLIYQVKHSHDKKKEFEESEAEASLKRDKAVKLGRKAIIRPRDEIISTRNSKHDEPIEEEEINEEDESKQEEDETEDKTVEEEKDSNVEDGQENSDAEADREEDSADENENQDIESEEGHGQTEGESVPDDNESMHEAREEHYKADDASSAVTHDQTNAGENENERTENSNKRVDNVSEKENKENNNSEENNTGEERRNLEVESGGTVAMVDRKSNTTTGETEVDVLGGSENGSPPNNTVIEMSDGDSSSNRSSEIEIENHDLHDIASEQTNNSIANDGFNVSKSSSTDSAETKDAEWHSQDLSHSSDNNAELESLWLEKNKTESLPEMSDEIVTEKSDYENSESTVIENLEEEIHHDGIDESDTSEKNVHTDLDTLPEIQTEGTSTEDVVAAE